jgi:hypothetical protein
MLVAVLAGLAVRRDGTPPASVPTVPGPLGSSGRALADPFAWAPGRDGELSRRAAVGTSHALYARSPGGAEVSAARTARWRGLVERTARTARVSADRLEALVLLESAGRPDALTGSGIEGAAGLTQILAETGRNLLGLRVDSAASARYGRRIARAAGEGRADRVRALERARARVDQRFDPAQALAATGRYLALAERRFGREDLAFVSYHMGIGNLEGVLSAYGAGRIAYARLYFDSTPARHAAAYRRLAAFGDDSSNYVWKLAAAEAIMRAYRSDRARLRRAATLQAFAQDARFVLHPPGEEAPAPHPVRALPAQTGLRRGGPLRLQPEALALALYAGAQVRALGGGAGRLTLARASASGWSFEIARRYASPAQARAFQFVLDRLGVLGIIAWAREGGVIHVTVARAAHALEPLLDRVDAG